jgi:ATP-dependent Lon protease
LLAGPPGTGKTRFAHRVAGLMGMGFGEISGAGSSDNRALQGTARGWSSASPSYVLHVIRQTRCTNPVILVDEIDKAAIGNTNGDIRSTLLAMLEPTTAKTWQDECLMASCNLSAVNWILTANDTSKLRGPLLTRLRVISVQAPTIDHFPSVLQSIRRDLASELKISTADLAELSPLAEAHLRKAFARDFSLRRIRAAVESAVKATKRIERLAH